jgi:hypothetical protein
MNCINRDSFYLLKVLVKAILVIDSLGTELTTLAMHVDG